MLPLLGATPLPYSKVNDISNNNGSQKKRRIKTENIYNVGLLSMRMVILWSRYMVAPIE